MILPESYEEIAAYIDSTKKVVFFFTADWCPDCQFIYPVMPSIEKDFSDFVFVRVNRDDYIELAQQWNIFWDSEFRCCGKWSGTGSFG